MKRPDSIFRRALALPAESHERWDQVVALHKRGDHATFRAAADLVESPDPATRMLGVDVLAQLGAESNVSVEQRPFAAPAAKLLLDTFLQKRTLRCWPASVLRSVICATRGAFLLCVV
jgi:hypothetical protein